MRGGSYATTKAHADHHQQDRRSRTDPAMANMQDIGGCRAVVSSLDELRRVEGRVKKRRSPARVDDYIETPRLSGYRGVHIIVEYDSKQIEIQLRTEGMHEW